MTYQNDKLDRLYSWKDSLKPIPVITVEELLRQVRKQIYLKGK